MSSPSECSIQVFCRVRPMNESEKRNGSAQITKFVSNKKDVVVGVGRRKIIFALALERSL